MTKVLLAQGGGPTAVINQSLVGAILEARKFHRVEKIYGALHGVRGIVDQDLVDLTEETTANLELVAATPSSALGSTRDKPDAKYCAEILRVARAQAIEYFFYMGGNDSADTVRIISGQAAADGYPLRCIHIPKTIDNDLTVNDHTPGFGSAARFVAQAYMGINLDNRALPGVYLGIIMGRNAGFLTAAAALARAFPDDGPHAVYLPERTFDTDAFLGEIKTHMDRHGRCVVAISEGITDAKKKPVAESLGQTDKDPHGNLQLGGGALGDFLSKLIKDRLGIKRVRSDTFGYLQRGFAGVVSDVDSREAREAGERAVKFAMAGAQNGTVTIHRTGDYAVDYRLSRLEEVAAKTKVMPDEFIAPSGNDVTDAFHHYARPLLGSDMPQMHRLRDNLVAKIHS
ncbi:MAG TPA: 6-phosphofructokinase [Rhizomicrobium sp.]|nr:6-phosphofructokinase [Rhizomicrobium sp.]